MDIFKDRVVAVTGGSGTFGRAFVKYVLNNFNPKSIRVISRNEHNQANMAAEFNSNKLRFFIGDVADRARMERALDGVDIVIHAAALKRVEVAEYNPFQTVQTNIIGTQNVIDAAINNKVEKLIALSTDKAANPVTLYGATKLCLEKIVVQGNSYIGDKSTKLSCVRYGNVVGSQGSVLPLFRKQALEGLLTITDERMTRFWITPEQAVQFVVTSLSMMEGGEIFIPKIPSVKIMDLARAVAPLAKYKYIGIRACEKLHEEMITENESINAYDIGDRYIILSPFCKKSKLASKGTKVSDGFSYSSDNNTEWLTEENLKGYER